MNEELRRRYVRDLIDDLQQVGGARLEQWIKPLWDHLAGAPVRPTGLNSEGTPVSGALDALWPDGSVSEASSDASYFIRPYRKPRHDFKHALKELPDVRTVRLFSSRSLSPSAATEAERRRRRLASRGYTLDLWDARRVAEYIVDELLLDQRFVARVGDALPNLERIAEQNAANALLPTIDPYYGGRDEEEGELEASLDERSCVVLAGMGGIGKSELACAVAHEQKDQFELVFWIDADKITSLNDLRSFDVRLNGYKLNLLHLLFDSKTLLILDTLKVNLDTEGLAASCGEGSRVIVTSQVAFGPAPVLLGFVGRERAREILSRNISSPCPSQALELVMEAVEGHPLALRLLNVVAARSGWDAVIRQCEHIAGLPDEKRRTIASRILEQHLEVLGPELAFFAWADSGSVDRGLFENVFGHGAIEKLEGWALTARSQSDTVRLHDLVYLSVQRIRHLLPIDEAAFTRDLESYIATRVSPKRLAFFRVVSRHRASIERLLRANVRPGALKYAYLHGHSAVRLDPMLIGDPAIDAAGYVQENHKLWLLSIVEAIEADYRRQRDLGDDTAKELLSTRLPIYDSLAARLDIDEATASIARYHKGKSLLKLGRVDEATAIFEVLVEEPAVTHGAKLQLARLLKGEPDRCKRLILELIEHEVAEPGTVSTSILLETLATTRRAHLRPAIRDVTDRFGQFMAQQIKAAACSGEDQPVRAFAAIGPDWAYTHPEMFQEVPDAIDFGSPQDAEDDDERVAIGRLLTAAGKKASRAGHSTEAYRRFESALEFLTALRRRSPFSMTHEADALLCLGREKEAADVLDQVSEEKREVFWLYRRSEAHLAADELEEALEKIDRALEIYTFGEHRPAFLAHRASVLFEMNDLTHEAVLLSAIELLTHGRFKDELTEVLSERRSQRHQHQIADP